MSNNVKKCNLFRMKHDAFVNFLYTVEDLTELWGLCFIQNLDVIPFYHLFIFSRMNEQDLVVARALAAESRENSPGGSPGPLRKSPLTKIADKLNTFR